MKIKDLPTPDLYGTIEMLEKALKVYPDNMDIQKTKRNIVLLKQEIEKREQINNEKFN